MPALHIRMSRWVVWDMKCSAALLVEERDARSHSRNVTFVLEPLARIVAMTLSALAALRPLM